MMQNWNTITTIKHDDRLEKDTLSPSKEEMWLRWVAMSHNWWIGGRASILQDWGKGRDQDWWSQQDQGKGPGVVRTARTGPYEGNRGKSWGKPEEDEVVQRPRKGKGGKRPEGKGGKLPELSWSEGRQPNWDEASRTNEQRPPEPPDPNRVVVLLEEVSGPKKGKVLLVSWESKRWTTPSKSVDHKDNELGFKDFPNMVAWEMLARQAIEEWTGITDETKLEVRHHGVYHATRYMVMTGRIEAALAESFQHRKRADVHKAVLFDLDDEAAYPVYQNVKEIMRMAKEELTNGVWEGEQPRTIEAGEFPAKPPAGLMGWTEFLGTLKGRLGYTNLPDLLEKRMSYRQWEHVLVKLSNKVSSLAVVEAARQENDPTELNPSVHVMVELRP